MTETINHATLHKELLHDVVSQDTFVYDQADFAAAILQENRLIYAVFQVHFWAHRRADNTFLRVAGSNLAIAIPTALFG